MNEAILWIVALVVGLGVILWFSRGDIAPLLTITVTQTEAADDDRLDQLYRRLWTEDDPAERAALYAEIEVLRR